LIIHEQNVGTMPSVGLDGFQARRDDLDYFMLAATDQVGQRCADASFVVRDQNAHDRRVAESDLSAERISASRLLEFW
jgi:hypothetical protein